MPFDLWTDGVTLVDRVVRLFNKTAIARDPLRGIVDGSNTLFYANHAPIITSGSVGLYTSGSAPLDTSAYALDYEAGLFTLVTAPTVQPTATYHTGRFSDMQIKSILVAGFDEMEGLWYRGLYLSNIVGQNAVVPITEDSAFAYVVNSSGSDPQMGSVYWGQSPTQLNFYAKCVQVAFYRTLMGENALSSLIWTEAQGIRIDRSRVVPNLKLAIDSAEKSLTRSLDAAMAEWYGDSGFGTMVLSPQTREMAAHRFWEGQSIAQNWRGTTQYTGHEW